MYVTISISGFFNDCCIFPFTYNGVSYNECINPVLTTAGPPTTAGPTGRLDPLGQDSGLWCATEINDDGSMKEWKGESKGEKGHKRAKVQVGGKRKIRCKKCTGCLAKKCMNCNHCKFPHLKKPCHDKVCLFPIAPKCPCFA